MAGEQSVKAFYADPEAWIGQTVEVTGWIRTQRVSKNVAFIELNDGTWFTNLQVVYGSSLPNSAEINGLTISSALRVTGTLVASPKAGQAFELKAEAIEVVGAAEGDYPLQKKRHSFEYLRTIAHLRPRTNTFSAVFRVRSLISYAIHRFFQQRGFVYTHTPILSASDCEGAGEMFRVTTLDLEKLPRTPDGKVDHARSLLGREAYLTVSGQLEVETHCMAFRKVYTFGPTFRAENSNTPRHASEFWMVEPEIAFGGLNEVMDLAEAMFKEIIRSVLAEAPKEMEFFDKRIDRGLIKRLEGIAAADFERLPYTEAIERLQRSGRSFEFPVEWGCDLQTEHERALTEHIVGRPVFVTDYPASIKAFYMRLNDDGRTVAATDLLLPKVGEIIGGSQREERHDLLVQRIEQSGLDPRDYWWYLDLRRYGTVPHAGFGLGLERAVMYLTGMDNIRDVLPFPRTPHNLEF